MKNSVHVGQHGMTCRKMCQNLFTGGRYENQIFFTTSNLFRCVAVIGQRSLRARGYSETQILPILRYGQGEIRPQQNADHVR